MEALLLQFFSALVGGLIVYVFSIRKLSIELRNAFILKQMSEFYSPIAGYRKRIRAKSEVRGKVSTAANEAWKETCAPYSEAKQPMHNHEELFALQEHHRYDNKQLREELMPLYRKILTSSPKNTGSLTKIRAHYQNFLEFVEIWERYLAEVLPGDVLRKLDHTEKTASFCEHVEGSSQLQKINPRAFGSCTCDKRT